MKIKFLTDFRGRETREQFYKTGQVVDVDAESAARLITDKRAEAVVNTPVAVVDEKPTAMPALRKKGRK